MRVLLIVFLVKNASRLNQFWPSLTPGVDGRLLAPRPYADICYGQTFNNAACSKLVANQGNEDFRASLPAALMYTQNELLLLVSQVCAQKTKSQW
jgi:hypothetical protein